jgi:L-2,4-diaminobutyric acid acetyltransferase
MSETPNRVGGGAGPTGQGLINDPPGDVLIHSPGDLSIEAPLLPDGAALWRIAADSGTLDLNSSYSYLLWCRDFADTSVVARFDGSVVGFVTGYLRPTALNTLMVWQVAVDSSHRGRGLAALLLDGLLDRLVPMGVRYLETTVTADNTASNRLFQSLATRWSAEIERTELFTAADFPDGHDTEFCYRIGPLSPQTRGGTTQ